MIRARTTHEPAGVQLPDTVGSLQNLLHRFHATGSLTHGQRRNSWRFSLGPSDRLPTARPCSFSTTSSRALLRGRGYAPGLQEEPLHLRPIDPDAPFSDSDSGKLAALDQFVATAAGYAQLRCRFGDREPDLVGLFVGSRFWRLRLHVAS